MLCIVYPYSWAKDVPNVVCSIHGSYKFKIDMKVRIDFMYYTHYVLINRVLLSMFVKNHCLKSHRCMYINTRGKKG